MSLTNVCHFTSYGVITFIGPALHTTWAVLASSPAFPRIYDHCIQSLSMMNQLKRERLMILHEKLGHAFKSKMKLVLAETFIDNLTSKDVSGPRKFCLEANTKRLPHPRKAVVIVTHFGQLIDWDCTGTQSVQKSWWYYRRSRSNGCVCRYGNSWFTFPVKSKMNSPHTVSKSPLPECATTKQRSYGPTRDQGPEFINYELGEILERLKVRHGTSNAGDSQGNGCAEHNIGMLGDDPCSHRCGKVRSSHVGRGDESRHGYSRVHALLCQSRLQKCVRDEDGTETRLVSLTYVW